LEIKLPAHEIGRDKKIHIVATCFVGLSRKLNELGCAISLAQYLAIIHVKFMLINIITEILLRSFDYKE
jgi:hypothetical protein